VWKVVGRGGSLLSTGRRVFSRTAAARLIGVLNIATAAVFPFILKHTQAGKLESAIEKTIL